MDLGPYIFLTKSCSSDLSDECAVPKEFNCVAWHPAGFAICMPGKSFSWHFFAWRIIFGVLRRNQKYGALAIYEGNRLVHYSMIFPPFFRFPFMAVLDTQVGSTWTEPGYRGRGLASCALQKICRAFHGEAGKIWYIARADNEVSVRVALRRGFEAIGRGRKVPRFGVGLLGYYRLTTTGPGNGGIGAVEQRKIIEKQLFDDLYRREVPNADPHLRQRLLEGSQGRFVEWLSKYAPGKRVLEIGCGDGTHSLIAAQMGAQVVSTDFSEEAIKLASVRAKSLGLSDKISFRTLDAENPDLPDRSFDLIINHEVFSSLDLRIALPRLARLLADDGVLIGTETFGHNPLMNFKRKLNVWAGTRTSWAAAHVFKNSDLDFARTLFSKVNVEYFHFLTLFAAPLLRLPFPKILDPLIGKLAELDKKLLGTRFFRKMAFKVVFEFKGPIREKR